MVSAKMILSFMYVISRIINLSYFKILKKKKKKAAGFGEEEEGGLVGGVQNLLLQLSG